MIWWKPGNTKNILVETWQHKHDLVEIWQHKHVMVETWQHKCPYPSPTFHIPSHLADRSCVLPRSQGMGAGHAASLLSTRRAAPSVGILAASSLRQCLSMRASVGDCIRRSQLPLLTASVRDSVNLSVSHIWKCSELCNFLTM